MRSGNEQLVGKAIRESGVPRSEIFLTTKLWYAEPGIPSSLSKLEAHIKTKPIQELGPWSSPRGI